MIRRNNRFLDMLSLYRSVRVDLVL